MGRNRYELLETSQTLSLLFSLSSSLNLSLTPCSSPPQGTWWYRLHTLSLLFSPSGYVVVSVTHLVSALLPLRVRGGIGYTPCLFSPSGYVVVSVTHLVSSPPQGTWWYRLHTLSLLFSPLRVRGGIGYTPCLCSSPPSGYVVVSVAHLVSALLPLRVRGGIGCTPCLCSSPPQGTWWYRLHTLSLLFSPSGYVVVSVTHLVSSPPQGTWWYRLHTLSLLPLRVRGGIGYTPCLCSSPPQGTWWYRLHTLSLLPLRGTWWYRSIRYSGDQILINTTQLFMHFMYKTPNMNMKRLSMVLTAAFEFDPRSNKEATIRPTDNIQVPQLIRELGNINVKKKEPPFCYPYSLKARVLVLAHLARMEVSDDIEEDQRFVVRKSPALLQEMVNVGCQLTMMANSRGGFHAPRLVSIENCMKLTQMIVQGLQESKSPLLQLPHFEEEHLRYCVSKKYKVRSLQDLVSLKDSDRRSMLRFLGEEKYDEVMAVLASFPSITMDTKLQVLDDEDSNNITAGSIVTVTVTLTRKRMAEVFEKEQNVTPCLGVGEEASTEDAVAQGDVSKTKAKVWQNKTKAAKKTKQSKKKKLTKKKPLPLPAAKAKQANGSASGSEVVAVAKEDEEDRSDKGSESEEGNKDSPSERDEESDKQSDTEQDEIAGDDEEEWEALQQSVQRRERALLETKSKVTHPVYSLYYPEEKHEWWWLYIADRKDQTLVSMPYHVCTLKDTEEVELKFPAPSKTGNYQYSVILRSDSYLGLDQIRPLKLEVHEAKAVLDNHPQWDIPETEEEDEEQEDSDGIEESEEEDEDND
uniref:SEC63 homolog, protein translocation regulator n=1 Tax=Oncorhynchus kisutch TaxID=8019 RepID=A0A8C7L3X4_ONCKI